MRTYDANRDPQRKARKDDTVMGLILLGIGLIALSGYGLMFFAGVF